MKGAGATTPRMKKNDGYSRVPLDAIVVRRLIILASYLTTSKVNVSHGPKRVASV
jgi:hypothetical protein